MDHTYPEELGLIRAALATCQIVSGGPDDDSRPFVATAFFISPTILVTAAHAIHKSAKIVYGQMPLVCGQFHPPKMIFEGAVGVTRFQFKVLKRVLDPGPPGIDMAILQTEHFLWGHFIHIEESGENQKIGDRVDVLGYPKYDKDWFDEMHPQLSDRRQGYKDAFEILQMEKLNISTGNLLSVGDDSSYRLSTSAGMSGGPVMHDTKAIGNLIPVLAN